MYIMYGIRKPMSVVSTAALIPDPVNINGIVFQRIMVETVTRLPPPVPVITGKTMVYYDPVRTVSFETEIERSWPPADDPPHTPAAVILLGEIGFDQPHPTYDCGDLSFLHSDIKAYHA